MNIQIQRNGTWQKVSKQELLELVGAGVVRPDTAVLYNDQQIVAARLKGLVFLSQQVAVPPPPPIAPQTARVVPVPRSAPQATNTSLDPVRRKDRITFWTMLCTVSYALLALAGIAGLLLMANTPHIAKEIQEMATTLSHEEANEAAKASIGLFYLYLALIIATGIPYMCCYYIWLRRLWEEVPQRFARTSPVNAALFSLIPFYNWYWNFTAFCGLYGGINKATKSYGLGSRFDGTWIKMVCIWWVISGVLGHVPPITSEPFLANITCGFLILLSIVCAAITLSTFWILRKDALEFIDIKASAGE